MEIKSIRDIKKYLEGNAKHYHAMETAQLVEDYYDRNRRKLEINMSSEYSQLIKEAARCNRYNSDIIYDIESIRDAFENFNAETDLPFFVIGFRRDGVDGNTFVLSRMEDRQPYDLYKEYFAIYFVEVKEEKDYSTFYEVEVTGYTL